MFVLQIEESMEHSDFTWLETRCLCVSESREKLQELSDKIKEESLIYNKELDKIRYLNISQKVKYEILSDVKLRLKYVNKYEVFRKIDDDCKLIISEIEKI